MVSVLDWGSSGREFESHHSDHSGTGLKKPVLSMFLNGIHAFPDKQAAFTETARVLKSGGVFCGCSYICGAAKRTDFLVSAVLAKKGWFTKPFLTAAELKASLKTHYADVAVQSDHAMDVFRCTK